MDKEVCITRGGDSVNCQFPWLCLGTPLNQGRKILLMGTQIFAPQLNASDEHD